MVDNQKKIQEVEEKIRKALNFGTGDFHLTGHHQIEFVSKFYDIWGEGTIPQEEKLSLIKKTLFYNNPDISYTTSDPYCPPKLWKLLDEWVIVNLEVQNQEISNILFSNQTYNFNQLKQEIIRLKTQDLTPQLQLKQSQFSEVSTWAKEQLSLDLKPILELYLTTFKQTDSELVRGQLKAYETILQTKLTTETIQRIKHLQMEIIQLEQHLKSLQTEQNTESEQLAQVVQLSSNNY